MQTLIRLLSCFPAARAWANRLIINHFANKTPPRPHRFSLWSPSDPATPAPVRNPHSASNVTPKPSPISSATGYTSWPSLVDRTFTARHLPPRVNDVHIPPPDETAVLALFKRAGSMRINPRSSVPLASEDSQIGVRMRVCLYGQDRTHPGSC